MIATRRRIGTIINESAASVSEMRIVEGGNRVTAEGVLQTGDVTNRNGRAYRTKDLASEIIAPRQKELFRTGNMFGEAGHPITQDLVRQQTIDPKCVCVRYLKFWMNGADVMGYFKGSNNKLGEAFDLDLRDGILPAFSLRALGAIEETAQGSVVTNLKMITYDYVIYPSHPTAYTKGIISESAVADAFSSSRVAKLVEASRLRGDRSFVSQFTNESVLEKMREIELQKESGAIDFICDTSHNFNLLKEAFDITKSSNIDLTVDGRLSITEAGVGTIVMNVEDYIQKEIMQYTRR